jgi:hypothetical protein
MKGRMRFHVVSSLVHLVSIVDLYHSLILHLDSYFMPPSCLSTSLIGPPSIVFAYSSHETQCYRFSSRKGELDIFIVRHPALVLTAAFPSPTHNSKGQYMPWFETNNKKIKSRAPARYSHTNINIQNKFKSQLLSYTATTAPSHLERLSGGVPKVRFTRSIMLYITSSCDNAGSRCLPLECLNDVGKRRQDRL